MNTQASVIRRAGVTAVHSLNRFVYTVPDLAEAERFYRTFGLDVRREGARLDLYTFGHPHRWASIHEAAGPKRLQYVSFGAYEDDCEALLQRLDDAGIERIEPHALAGDAGGVWFRDPDGTPLQVLVAAKTTADERSTAAGRAGLVPGRGAAPSRSAAPAIRPRRLSHILLFSADVPRAVRFYSDVLGLRLSDHSGDIIAFLHAPHASDHHLVAFAKSGGPGLHHSSWDVGSIDEVGLGMEQMTKAGYTRGWGVGRHVLGSNYFYYVRDPWGSWAEYSFDIDFVPHDVDWQSGDHPPEDSLYVWGPSVPEEFVVNHELAQHA